jgi:hypothetical protein
LREQALREALAAARKIQSDESCAKVLRDLTSYLPEGLLSEALAVAREIEADRWRAEALMDLTPYLDVLPPMTLARLWLEERDGANLLHFLARRPRKHLLSDLRALAPVLAALGGPEAVAETVRAIQDVGRWWP